MEKGLVLVVDDDPICRDALEMVIRWSGFRVVSVDNGCDAIRIALAARPALVFTDVMMPGVDGCETTKAIRQSLPTSDTYIVALSANSDLASRTKTLEAGVDEFIAKPWNISDIRQVLRHCRRKAFAAAGGSRAA